MKKMVFQTLCVIVIYFRSRELTFKWTKANLLSTAVFGFVRYLLSKWVCNFVFKILNENKSNFWTDLLLWKKIICKIYKFL
jgi:hypothetical protein